MTRLVEKEPAPLYEKPDPESETIPDLKAGEGFALLEIAGAWAWGYRQSDHLVGYMEASLLSSPGS